MTTILVDGNNLALRSFHAPKAEMSSQGMDTGTLVLFINSLARYVKIDRPDKGLIAWDGGYSAYRKHIFPAYKENRKQKSSDEPSPPFLLLQQFLYLAGFPQLQLPGYEGDDIIGACWRACRGRENVKIISSDKDLFQLVQGSTEQIRLTSNHDKVDRWDRTRIITEKGFKPENAVAVMALMGDRIDGSAGLERVGPKTAVKMLKECDWDVERLLNCLAKEQQERFLLNLALMDLSLVPLELDEPPALKLVRNPDDSRWDNLMNFCDEYELKQIKSKLELDILWI